MSLEVPTKEIATGNPSAKKRRIVLPVVLVLLTALLGGAGWYYFFGSKPKIAMSLALPVKGELGERALWSAGAGQLLLLADGQVRLVDIGERKEKWSVKMPAQPSADMARQAAVNARFLRLQQWADELALKRARLTSDAETKAFNAEVAKYHVELSAARTEIAQPKAPPAAAPTPPPAAKPAHVFGGDRSAVDALHPVADSGVQILRERVKKRGAKLQAWRTTLDAKKANAKSALQKSAAAEEEARYAAEMAVQRKEEEAIEKTKPKAPAPAVSVAVSEPEPEEPSFGEDFGTAGPMAAICGDMLWIVEGRHAVAFDRASGAVKADVSLAGAARQVFADGGTAFVIASAGAEAVQVTRLAAGAQPQSSYFSTGRREYAFEMSDGSSTPSIQNQRTEFSVAGGSLVRVEIRLREKSIRTRDAIKPGSEKELEFTAGNSAAHSVDELKSLTALIRNDAARLNGQAIERVDDSSYDIVVRRPFEPQVPEWSGTLRGRVQVFSTLTLHLITAGTKLLAFDHTNKKVWEATLGSPVPIRRSDSESASQPQPWLETGGRLFFADGAFLTVLDAKSGQVAWRLPSVGIRKLQVDGEGNLYVLSDNLHVESLTYATDAGLGDSTPITMRVNAADGKIQWQVEKYQDLWASGKDVYVMREANNPSDVEAKVFDPAKAIEARVKICKLSRGSGKPLWEWFQPRRPRAVEVQGKNVALLFGDELQIIRSICW
jgi:hypothetical protein